MTANTWDVASGATLYAGRNASSGGGGLPSWLTTVPLNEWHVVPNSAGAGGSSVDVYSTFTLVGTDIWIAAQGGHGDSSDTRVVKMPLLTETPAWELKQAASTAVNNNQPYTLDSPPRPSSRHGYYGTIYSPSINKVLLVGCNYTGTQAYQFPTVDGFSPGASSFSWDTPGTYAYGVANYPAPVGGVYNSNAGGRYGVVMGNNGYIWDEFAQSYYDPVTNTWTFNASNASAAGGSPRYPWANHAPGDFLFGMAYGDGSDITTNAIHAKKMVANNQTTVTFNPSAAVTQFLADQQIYGGMFLNPNNGKFLWYGGNIAGRLWEITLTGNTADMAAFAYGSGSLVPVTTNSSGICGRFKYCPELNCAILLPRSSGSVYFMRLG